MDSKVTATETAPDCPIYQNKFEELEATVPGFREYARRAAERQRKIWECQCSIPHDQTRQPPFYCLKGDE